MQHVGSRSSPRSETCSEHKREGPSASDAGHYGYRVDFDLDDLQGTNGRVIAQCVRFSSTSFIVPLEQPIHLLFLRMVFNRLRAQCRCFGSCEDPGDEKLPVEAFHRAFQRLFFVLQDPKGFCVKEFDENGDGYVSWIEFFNVYRQRNITVRLSLCERIFLTFDDPDSSMFAQIVSLVVLTIIVISSLCFVLSTVDEFQVGVRPLTEAPAAAPILKRVDTVCLMLFCVEYIVRLATVWNVRMELFRKAKLLNLIVGFEPISLPGPLLRVLKFVFQPANLIDLAAILPAVLSLFISSNNSGLVVLRLIRLTRIFRAFKSPALIEPVIIIGRTLQQSTKALYVLAFNLLLGIVISGSLMYLAEGQGTWSQEDQRYTRTAGWRWNATSQQMVEEKEISPFQSIPHTFWWAIVTVATVGYGESNNYPRTAGGYVVTTLTMVFSLVMLALPVGVIGGTFSQVWAEFDEEKAKEADMMRQELFFVTTSLQRLDPEQMSRMMLIEVWDDHGTSSEASKVRSSPYHFMGEAKLELELPCNARVTREKTVQLQPNMDLVCRKVTGEVTLRYSWTPSALKDLSPTSSAALSSTHLKAVDVIGAGKMTDPDLCGTLEVTVISAYRLLNLGITGRHGASNPYCMVFVYPRRPAEGGLLQPCVWRTPTAPRTMSPSWHVSHSFGYDWRRSDARGLQVASDEESGSKSTQLAAVDTGVPGEKLGEVLQLLRYLAVELRQVKEDVRTLAGRLDRLAPNPEPSDGRPRAGSDRQQASAAAGAGG